MFSLIFKQPLFSRIRQYKTQLSTFQLLSGKRKVTLKFYHLNQNTILQLIQTQMNIDEKYGSHEDEDEEEFEIVAVNELSSPQDIYFDQVVGELQEIICDSAFQNIQSHFMKKYCQAFQNTQENKNEYMDIFKLYQQQIESYVDKNLHQKIAEFDMPKFLALLQKRTDQIDQNILDMLQSFTDFEVFKQLMLDFKSYLSNEDNLKSLTIKSNRFS